MTAVFRDRRAYGLSKEQGEHMQRWSVAMVAAGLSLLCACSGAAGLTDADKCEARKLRIAGKYALCRLKAHSKAGKRGAAPDFTKCDSRFQKAWSIIEADAGGACPTIGDAAVVQNQLTTCSDGVAQSVMPPTTTPTASVTPTPTITSTPTATATQVLVNIGSSFNPPACPVTLPTLLVANGFQVVGTANDFTYDTTLFSLDLATCVINPALAGLKELVVSEIDSTATTRTVRAVVSDTGGGTIIPDGALYSCTFRILIATYPGSYPVPNSNQEAYDVVGTLLPTGGNTYGIIAVVLGIPSCNFVP